MWTWGLGLGTVVLQAVGLGARPLVTKAEAWGLGEVSVFVCLQLWTVTVLVLPWLHPLSSQGDGWA